MTPAHPRDGHARGVTLRDHLRPRRPSTLLRQLVSPFWGTSVGGRKCVWDEAKDGHLAYHKRNGYWRHLKTWRIDAHFGGRATLFGQNWVGNDRAMRTVLQNGKRYRLLLAMVDIDCHGQGSTSGADAARAAIDAFLPGVWWEPSTSGVGRHGYLGVLVLDEDDPAAPFEDLELLLKQIVRHCGADVTGVECKGRPAVVDHRRRGYQTLATTLKGGDHFKLPRGLADRYDEFLDSPAVTAGQITDLAKAVASHAAATPPAPPAPDYKDDAGSGGQLVTSERIALARSILPRAVRHVAALGLPVQRLRRRVIDDELYAAVLVCRAVAPAKKDGSMSVRRIGLVWDGLYEAGVLSRRFHPAAFAAARNALTDKGCVDWQDADYWYGHSHGGEEVRGRACRWDIEGGVKDAISGSYTATTSGGESVDTKFHKDFGKRPVLNLHRGRLAVPWYRDGHLRTASTAAGVEWHEQHGYVWRQAA